MGKGIKALFAGWDLNTWVVVSSMLIGIFSMGMSLQTLRDGQEQSRVLLVEVRNDLKDGQQRQDMILQDHAQSIDRVQSYLASRDPDAAHWFDRPKTP